MQTRTSFACTPYRTRFAVLALTLLLPGIASATGFFINQQSVKGLGRVDAGNTAAADDLGTLFFNPAGMTELWKRERFARGDGTEPRTMWSFGAHLVIGRTRINDAGSTLATPGTLGADVASGGGPSRNPVHPTPITNFYIAHRLNEQFSVGFAGNVPFGLATEFNPAWFGRYDAIEASLRTINLSGVVAMKITESLSIGGGIDAQYARTTLSTAIPNPLAPPAPATDARVTSKADTWSPGFNVGVLYKFDHDRTRVGAHFRSGMRHDLKGSSTFSGFGGVLAAQNGTVGSNAVLHLPAIVTLGVRHAVTDNLTLLGELEWYNWSKFKEIRQNFDDPTKPPGLRVVNFRDTWAIAAGAEYKLPRPGWTVRGGVQFDRTPTQDGFRDTTVPDDNRLWLGLGATWRKSDRVSFDFAFNHVFFKDTNVNVTRQFFEGTALSSTARINGTATNVVNTITVDLRVAY
ncbi:MAG TPA: outer membrane protein transport protein [Burkholderiales bacterium]|nr:outer membrane protein transport protein [Burkholderiales bacterium]